MDVVCPHCKGTLNKIPMRKSKCPNCKNDIYVRTNQKIFPSSLLTKDEAIAVDYLKELEGFGIIFVDYLYKKNELSKRFGREPQSTDILWGLYNELILRTKDYQSLSSIYRSMAFFLNKEGKDSFEVLKLSQENFLKYYEKSVVIEKVKIFTCGIGVSCKECEKLEGKIFEIEEALKEMPLPNKNCIYEKHDKKHGFCRCVYIGAD